MQIIESTDWAVRTARITLHNAQTQKTIVLFPMLHIGEPTFFQSVYNDAFSLDVVLLEGVNSPIGRRIVRSYSWVEHSKRINLVVQPPYPSQNDSRVRIVRSDLPAEVFEQLWRQMPIWQRALVYILAPMIGLHRRWMGSRQQLAKDLSMDDLPSREEYLNAHEESGFMNYAILQARDEHLIKRLHEELRLLPDGAMTIGIVYGALHMRAVLRDLIGKEGYSSIRSDWVTVFYL